MAENKQTPNKKRRLKPTPVSVREHRDKASKPKPSKVGSLLRRLFNQLAKPLAWIKNLKIWRSPALKPFRFIFKIIGYILFIPQLTNSFRELRQVTWPDFRQTNRLTVAVLIFAIFFGAITAAIDYGFDKLFEELIL